MRASITSLGKFLPNKIIKNSEFENFLDTSDEWIRSRTGVRPTIKMYQSDIVINIYVNRTQFFHGKKAK